MPNITYYKNRRKRMLNALPKIKCDYKKNIVEKALKGCNKKIAELQAERLRRKK